jgi:hypothetical protein
VKSMAQAVEQVLQQGLNLLSELDGSCFETVAAAPYNASIGQHYRHVLDHFLCLETGIFTGVIDYDRRERNPRLEIDIEFARDVTNRLIRVFQTYDRKILAAQCDVQYRVGYGDAQPMFLPSFVARELAFCIGHAIHHYAIIRLLCDSIGVEVVSEFGVAPSTVQYRAEQMLAEDCNASA